MRTGSPARGWSRIRAGIAHRLLPLRDRPWLLQRLGLDRLLGPREFAGGKIRRAYPKAVRPAMVNPPVLPASAASHMQDDDLVLGVVVDGEARAYPWWLLLLRHVANDVVAGRPVAVILCHQCGSGMAFDPVVGGHRLTFEVRDIYNGTAAMRDHQTDSLWAPFLGMAIQGQLKGSGLTPLPLWQMNWGPWRELHPETLVLPDDRESQPWRRARIDRQTIGRSFRESAARMDPRLPPSTLVLGVVTSGGQRAYRMDALTSGDGVVNDEVGGVPVVVLAHPAQGSYGAAAFSRSIDGRPITFDPGADGPVDRETGSRWNLQGRATEGPLAGTQLPYVASHVAMWYVWAAHFPGLEIAP